MRRRKSQIKMSRGKSEVEGISGKDGLLPDYH